MKKPFFLRMVFFLSLLSLFSCNGLSEIDYSGDTSFVNEETIYYSVDEALVNLDNFLQETNLTATRTGFTAIKSIEKFRKETLTRVSLENNGYDAYLINFVDNGGFAVLGANSNIPRIVAVMEDAQINSDLSVTLSQFESSMQSEADEDDEEDIVDIPRWCEEDNDFYSAKLVIGNETELLISNLIRDGVSTDKEYVLSDNESQNCYVTKTPMLVTNWGQSYMYNNYCKRGISKQKSAYTGCSNTAIAMIMTHNEYPELTINSTKLDWKKMKADTTIYRLDSNSQDQVALLLGYIFNNVTKITSKSFTLITPAQIAKLMRRLGYTNVDRMCGHNLSSNMIESISNMLKENKPVFISALPKKLAYAHSWVIDGAKYSGSDYLLHFNFGWQGSNNGYFSTECLNPAKGEYDEIGFTPDDDDDYEYKNHFRVITYDIPQGNSNPLSVTFDNF